MQTLFFLFTAFLFGVLLAFIFTLISHYLTPPRRGGEKHIVYEAGVRPLPSTIVYNTEKYLPFIIAYVAFDIMVSYLVILSYNGVFESVLLKYLIFTLIPSIIVFLAYARGLLRWE